MVSVAKAVRKIVHRLVNAREPVDSEIPSELIVPSRAEREQDLEQTLQAIARNQFGLPVKVAVFKRVKSNRGQVLALVRMQAPDLPAPQDPQQFVQQLVLAFNTRAKYSFQKHIDYAIWSDLESNPTQVHSQWDVVHRT
ncbi:hypothetical protein RQP54_17665 [Curvibacter sp. APW13]|uniref:hypothetical protein n=1 Tax=Curvibacter sp. APW13 TaxID=3077236 RepID=UPI0028DF8BFD|nr:hypothetical protein [Curvibacter sp. APW13]MDT8992704.1 hypothetical protein [Curvibacter sp. APW13]